MGNFPTGVTTTFTANTKAKSAEINTNFSDVVSWHNSFSKDLKNGTVYLQTSAKSADYTVTDTDGIRTILMTTGASNRTVTLPTAADNTGRLLRIKKIDTGAGTCIIDGENSETIEGSTTQTLMYFGEWIDLQCDGTMWHIVGKMILCNDPSNYSIAASVGSNALTLALKTRDGADPDSGDGIAFFFRNATSATGDVAVARAVAATSIVVSSGSTLGTVNGQASYLYLYAINNSGTVELAVSSTLFDDMSVQSTTAEGGAGAADSATVLYSTTARSNKAIKLIARIKNSQTTAGTWAAVPTEISLTQNQTPLSSLSFTNAAAEYAAFTRLGLMQYLHGTNYNNGNAPTVSCSATGASITRAVFMPYQTISGAWRLKFSINIAYTSGSGVSANFTVNSVTLKQVSGMTQAFSLSTFDGSGLAYSTGAAVAYSNNNTFYANITGTSTTMCASGDMELDSKPNWAY